MSTTKLPAKPVYDPKFYDAGYYGGGSRGGFTSYDYHSPEQKKQLELKWDACAAVPHESALFIGCARGFEVAHWLAKKKHSFGIDVSKWAVENAIPECNGQVLRYDGRRLVFWGENAFDLVACFDVLPHLPEDMARDVASLMVRIAGRGIVWRQIVKNWRNLDSTVDFEDGAVGVYHTFEWWDRLFTESGKFRLEFVRMHSQYEATATFLRNSP